MILVQKKKARGRAPEMAGPVPSVQKKNVRGKGGRRNLREQKWGKKSIVHFPYKKRGP